MKMNKKTVIIILVIIVAGFLIWRNRKGTPVYGTDASALSEPSDSPNTSLDYILSHVELNSVEREKIDRVRQKLTPGTAFYQNIQAKAYKNGLSFDQQMVCDAMWQLYKIDNRIDFDEYYRVVKEVKKLS